MDMLVAHVTARGELASRVGTDEDRVRCWACGGTIAMPVLLYVPLRSRSSANSSAMHKLEAMRASLLVPTSCTRQEAGDGTPRIRPGDGRRLQDPLPPQQINTAGSSGQPVRLPDPRALPGVPGGRIKTSHAAPIPGCRKRDGPALYSRNLGGVLCDSDISPKRDQAN